MDAGDTTEGASGSGGKDGVSGVVAGHKANVASQGHSRPTLPPTVLAPAINRDQIMATLKQLGDLKASGALTAEEFAAKRRELLDKL